MGIKAFEMDLELKWLLVTFLPVPYKVHAHWGVNGLKITCYWVVAITAAGSV